LEKYRVGIIGLGWMGWLSDVADRSSTGEMGLGGPEGVEARGRKGKGMPRLEKRPFQDWLIPDTHAGSFAQHPKTKLVAASEFNEERLREFGKHYGIKALYSDWREMLEQESLDIIDICTNVKPRPEIVLAAAAKEGVKGMYTEKPISESLEEADAMVEACERRGIVAVGGAISVNHPAFAKARAMIENGEIGKVSTITGGTWIGQHNQWVYLVGNEADWVVGISQDEQRAKTDFEFQGIGYVHFKNGVLGRAVPPSLEMEIMGETGKLTFDFYKGFKLWKHMQVSGAHHGWAYIEFPWGEPQFSMPYAIWGVDDLVRCMELGGEPRVSLRRVRHAMEIEIALRESSRKGNMKVQLPIKDRKLKMIYEGR